MFTTDPVLKIFYAYLWLRADGTPYYAGKGCGQRAFVHKKPPYPPKDLSRILVFSRSSEQAAIETEKELICSWGRKDIGTGCLLNRTEGGDGISGAVILTPKTPKALKAALENVKKATAAIIGKPKTEEQRRKNSESHKGIQRSAEHSQHISEGKKGKKVPNLNGVKNARWGKLPTNIDTLRALNASRPRDAQGRFFNA